MKRMFNIAWLVLFACCVAAGAERIYWVNSGSGLAGMINVSQTADLGITCDRSPLIEVKRLPDGSMQWRCGDIYPFATSGQSKPLADRFDLAFKGGTRS